MIAYYVLVVFIFFIVKHWICDFVLQYDYMVEEKGTYGARGGLEHAAVHFAGTLIVLILSWSWGHWSYPLAVSVIDAVIHYHIDWGKMKLSQGLGPQDHKFWIWVGFDQMLHYLTYAFIIGFLLL